MIDHLGLNVGNLEKSKAFYQSALAPLDYVLENDFGPTLSFAHKENPVGSIWLISDTPALYHFALSAASQAEVDDFYAAALAAGGTDNGAPGLRPHYHANYYAAFVLDPDGYNVEVVYHGN